jgi:uncharacterized membrane protein YfcA
METYVLVLLCLAAFAAGFIDAIVGGGGLIQTPMGLILLPNLPISTVIGTLKVPAFSGTSFAAHIEKNHSPRTQIFNAIGISFIVGLYDGFIGPGTGSFLVVAFIAIMGFDFLHASANAKMVNLATNFGSICLFILKGKIIWAIALPMAASNSLGGWMGAKLAINKGNSFIRIFFLVVVVGTLIRFAYDVFFK